METQRMLLFVAMAFIVLVLWEQWQADYGPKPVPVEQVSETPADIARPDVPEGTSAAAPALEAPATEMKALDSAKNIHVRTDIFDLHIDTKGGDIRRGDLLEYPVDIESPNTPFTLLNDEFPNLFLVQSGLLSSEADAPNHHAIYQTEQTEYQMLPGQDTLEVDMVWQSDSGIRVTKRFIFSRGDYAVKVEHIIRNDSTEVWRGSDYRQFQRSQPPKSAASNLIHTYLGGVIYSDAEKYEKISFDDMNDANLSRDIQGGWAAMIQHYFLGAWIPAPDQNEHYYTKALPGGRYVIGLVSPKLEVAPGESSTFESTVYIGPKNQAKLAELAEGLELTVDYGWLTVLAKPLFWLLQQFHSLFGNWGWAIIMVTVCIKAVFYKLSETSYRSMANMRKVTPRMKAMKERYGDDKQGLQKAMMDLYKTEKINPLGGCLPILVQIPVFIALYWTLLESVELRQAPFIFWLEDLSIADPYFVLPLLMGITMLIQQKLNPAPLDPIQQKVMMVLPIVFTIFFAFFPSGLVLYWVVNNTLSIAQQWMITRRIEQGEKA